jgi:hypothetical protein
MLFGSALNLHGPLSVKVGYQPLEDRAFQQLKATRAPLRPSYRNDIKLPVSLRCGEAPARQKGRVIVHPGSHSPGHSKLTSQRTIWLVKITNEKQMLRTYEEEHNGHRDKGRRIGYYEEGNGLGTFVFDFDY